MKKILLLSTLFCFLLSCNSGKKVVYTTEENGKENAKRLDKTHVYTNLADYLRHKTNIQVGGFGDQVRLEIRGRNSFQNDTRPFIYIDNIPVGRDYVSADQAVNPNQIIRVEVLSSLSEIAKYGGDGRNGIIKITTSATKPKTPKE